MWSCLDHFSSYSAASRCSPAGVLPREVVQCVRQSEEHAAHPHQTTATAGKLVPGQERHRQGECKRKYTN